MTQYTEQANAFMEAGKQDVEEILIADENRYES